VCNPVHDPLWTVPWSWRAKSLCSRSDSTCVTSVVVLRLSYAWCAPGQCTPFRDTVTQLEFIMQEKLAHTWLQSCYDIWRKSDPSYQPACKVANGNTVRVLEAAALVMAASRASPSYDCSAAAHQWALEWQLLNAARFVYRYLRKLHSLMR
jgi:hypothetical protein